VGGQWLDRGFHTTRRALIKSNVDRRVCGFLWYPRTPMVVGAVLKSERGRASVHNPAWSIRFSSDLTASSRGSAFARDNASKSCIFS
jgi:hypothetical protein